MVDRTEYPGKVPELSLRQIFGRQKLERNLCVLAAECGLLSIEMFAMLGDTIQGVKATLQTLIADEAKLGADESSRALSLTALAAVWKMCSTLQEQFASRRAKMEEDPSKIPEIPGDDHAEFRDQFVSAHQDVVLPPHREPHRKFVERLQRDYLVHGSVPFYEVGEIRTRTEQIVQKSGLSKNSEDLLRVVTVDQPVAAASESQVIDKLYAFFIALEYLNICEFTVKDGPLKYLSELEEWRHENRGLALLLSVDSLIRKKVHRLNSDHRKTYPTFKSALLEVLLNHKQLWPARVQSWTSSDRLDMRILLRPIEVTRGLRQKRQHPQRRLARTRLGERDRRRSWHKLVHRSMAMRSTLIGKDLIRLRRMLVCQPRSGQQSRPSSTMALVGVLSSIARSAAGSATSANTSMCAWSVVSHTRGTEIIERIPLRPSVLGSALVA